MRGLTVVTRAQLLCFDVWSGLTHVTGSRGRGRGGRGGDGCFAAPGSPTGPRVAVRSNINTRVGLRNHGGGYRVPIDGKVLIELTHIKGLHVAHDVCTELRYVYVTEVNVLTPSVQQPPAFILHVLLSAMTMVKVGLRGCWWCWWSMGLT